MSPRMEKSKGGFPITIDRRCETSVFVSTCGFWETIKYGPWYDVYFIGVHRWGTLDLTKAMLSITRGEYVK